MVLVSKYDKNQQGLVYKMELPIKAGIISQYVLINNVANASNRNDVLSGESNHANAVHRSF